LGDVIEHEALALVVLEHPAVAPNALGHEDPAHGRWPHHPRRVELDELHVDQIRARPERSEEHTSELQSRFDVVCRLLLEKKKGTYAARGRVRTPRRRTSRTDHARPRSCPGPSHSPSTDNG